MFGVLAHGGTKPLSKPELAGLCRLMVQAHSGFVHAEESGDAQAFYALRARCESLMASRALEVAAACAADGSVLTEAARAVLESLVPSSLHWTPVAPSSGGGGGGGAFQSGCFEAVAPGPHLISVNPLSGAVLIDGSPPRSLPEQILQHALYKRTFGERDFEVAHVRGALQTKRPLNGRVYRFALGSDTQAADGSRSHLFVEELTEEDAAAAAAGKAVKEELELLDGQSADWAADLPVRLRDLQSFWLCRKAGVLLLRPPAVSAGREASFVVLLGGVGVLAVTLAASAAERAARAGDLCVRVPSHFRSLPWQELASKARSGAEPLNFALIVWPGGTASAPAASVLGKFEADRFVHWFLDRASGGSAGGGLPVLRSGAQASAADADAGQQQQPHAFRLELPRFGLEFELRSGVLSSCNFRGYHLAQAQQLSDTLPGFSQYLVLEPGASLSELPPWGAPYKLVVPAGSVERSGGPCAAPVVIRASENDDASCLQRGYSALEIHRRFQEIRARTIAARLQLAALYAATDRGVPEERAGMTGAEAAMQLVRGSFVNRPLSPEEGAQCASAAAFGVSAACPALHLLCASLAATAAQLAFLRPEQPEPPQLTEKEAGALADSRTEYTAYVCRGKCNPRRLLTEEEEVRALGRRAPPQPAPHRPLPATATPVVRVPKAPVSVGFVKAAEARLLSLVVEKPPESPRPCPLSAAQWPKERRGELGAEMLQELSDSWDANEHLPQRHIGLTSSPVSPALAAVAGCAAGGSSAGDQPPRKRKSRDATGVSAGSAPPAPTVAVAGVASLLGIFEEMLAEASGKRQQAETHLLESLRLEPEAADHATAWHVPAQRLLRAGGRVPQATLQDLVRTLWCPSAVSGLSVFLGLSAADRSALREGVLAWLQLCVLEDKLRRLRAMAAVASEEEDFAGILKELCVHRTWDPDADPEWLAFEADGAQRSHNCPSRPVHMSLLWHGSHSCCQGLVRLCTQHRNDCSRR